MLNPQHYLGVHWGSIQTTRVEQKYVRHAAPRGAKFSGYGRMLSDKAALSKRH